MSRENVEIVQRAYVALSQGDSDAIYDLAPPEFVVDFSRRLVDPFVLRGRDEALGFFLRESREGAWESSPVWEPQELINARWGRKVELQDFCAARPVMSGRSLR